MELMLEIYAVVITLFSLLFLTLYLLHKKQTRTLGKKLRFVQRRKTNMLLTADFPSKDVNLLVNAMNELLENDRHYIAEMEKKENSVKETITNISHDLRTPLTAIQGYTQMLAASEVLLSEEKEAVAIINERVGALNQMLNQLFEFARLEAGEMKLEAGNVDLNAILKATILSFYHNFEERLETPEFEIADEKFMFYGDENAITRIFTNIIYNALVHGKDAYKIRSFRQEGYYIFCFQNRTTDILKEDMEQLFERFYTTDKSRTKKTTGLGLTIAQKLTQQMGGQIQAELENEIFKITIRFPIAALSEE